MSGVEVWYKHGPDQPVIVNTSEQMDHLIDRLLTEPRKNSIATLYHLARPTDELDAPDHELEIAVNAQNNVGALSYGGGVSGEEGTWFSKAAPSTSEGDSIYYYYMGNDHEFPHDSEIPLDLVRQAAREFLANGGDRPECIDWQPWQPKNGSDANQ